MNRHFSLLLGWGVDPINIFIHEKKHCRRFQAFPLHPNTFWEGIWIPKIYLKQQTSGGMFGRVGIIYIGSTPHSDYSHHQEYDIFSREAQPKPYQLFGPSAFSVILAPQKQANWDHGVLVHWNLDHCVWSWTTNTFSGTNCGDVPQKSFFFSVVVVVVGGGGGGGGGGGVVVVVVVGGGGGGGGGYKFLVWISSSSRSVKGCFYWKNHEKLRWLVLLVEFH